MDYFLIALLLVAVSVLLVAAFDCRLKNIYYPITTAKNFGKNSMRLILISDLHSRWHGKNQFKLIKRIKDANPDLILLVGDIFDDTACIDGAKSLLQQLNKLGIPTFFAPGNHEYRSKKIDVVFNLFRSNNITILEDSYCSININGLNLRVAGTADLLIKKFVNPEYSQENASFAAFGSIDDSEYNILLTHRPSGIYLYKKFPFDLVLSGHLHGGQVRIPYLINGLFSRSDGFFPKYAGGIYKHGKLIHIISRGVSVNPPFVPRVFNNTELVIIDVRHIES